MIDYSLHRFSTKATDVLTWRTWVEGDTRHHIVRILHFPPVCVGCLGFDEDCLPEIHEDPITNPSNLSGVDVFVIDDHRPTLMVSNGQTVGLVEPDS